jgi:teichoic acid transport system ATP-binding protein
MDGPTEDVLKEYEAFTGDKADKPKPKPKAAAVPS